MKIGSREWLDWHTASIACPIPWCTGNRGQHGGEGDGPDTWLHCDDGRSLTESATLYRFKEGSGPVSYSVHIGGQVVIEEAVSLDEVARAMRTIADACATLAKDDRVQM